MYLFRHFVNSIGPLNEASTPRGFLCYMHVTCDCLSAKKVSTFMWLNRSVTDSLNGTNVILLSCKTCPVMNIAQHIVLHPPYVKWPSPPSPPHLIDHLRSSTTSSSFHYIGHKFLLFVILKRKLVQRGNSINPQDAFQGGRPFSYM